MDHFFFFPLGKELAVFLLPTFLMTLLGTNFPGLAAEGLLALNWTVSPLFGPLVTFRVLVDPGFALPFAFLAILALVG